MPLNETEERYEIDLKDPAAYATDYLIGAPAAAAVRGTRTVTGTRSLTLTDAELQAIYPDGLWVHPSTITNGKFLSLSLAGWTTDSGAVNTDDAPRGGLGAVGDGVFPDTFCYAGSSAAEPDQPDPGAAAGARPGHGRSGPLRLLGRRHRELGHARRHGHAHRARARWQQCLARLGQLGGLDPDRAQQLAERQDRRP